VTLLSKFTPFHIDVLTSIARLPGDLEAAVEDGLCRRRGRLARCDDAIDNNGLKSLERVETLGRYTNLVGPKDARLSVRGCQ
jgi:hypothetical protein